MKELTQAQTIVREVLKVKKGERVLIIANPETNVIAQELYEASREVDAAAVLIFQSAKTSFDAAAPEVIEAIATNPDVCISVSSIKLGKDVKAIAKPYLDDKGVEYDHIFDYLLSGKKSMRAVWMPGITQEIYERCVQIDYKELDARCAKLEKLYRGVVSVHVTSNGGSDIIVPVNGRAAMSDSGDFSKAGLGGNIPAGEVFISPVVGDGKGVGTEGVIVYDGSMTFADGDAILNTPIRVQVEHGFVTDISGGDEAARLKKTILEAEAKSIAMEKEGKLPKGMGDVYKRNARNIGELGIGLNPAAIVAGNMLEDEKAFRTCHFAIGENYDNDAPSLIHLDGVVRDPTIEFTYENGSTRVVLENGELKI